MSQQHSLKFLRKRKALLLFPLMVLPVLLLSFYVLGGGKDVSDPAGTTGQGFNTTLPEPYFDKKEANMNKLQFYEQAARDSVKLRGSSPGTLANTGIQTTENPNAEKLLQRLGQLKQMINQPAMAPGKETGFTPVAPSSITGERIPEVSRGGAQEASRLERLMQSVKISDTSSDDPQLDKLNGMLDKIIRIQHPGQGPAAESQALPNTKANAGILRVTTGTPPRPVNDLELPGDLTPPGPNADSTVDTDMSGFYWIDDTDPADSSAHNTITAVIPEDQTLVAGSTIKLRITEDAFIKGITIPRDNLLYGQVSLNNDRMMVNINSIGYDNSVYPVSLQVYDMDGQPGIYIPGTINRDVAKQSADQGINSIGLGSFDSSVGAQATTAGIQVAKTLLSKKIRLIRVFVRAGYQVLLKNSDQK